MRAPKNTKVFKNKPKDYHQGYVRHGHTHARTHAAVEAPPVNTRVRHVNGRDTNIVVGGWGGGEGRLSRVSLSSGPKIAGINKRVPVYPKRNLLTAAAATKRDGKKKINDPESRGGYGIFPVARTTLFTWWPVVSAAVVLVVFFFFFVF